MTSEDVLRIHREVFYQSLLTQDWQSLSSLYADDYTLVRSNGAVLSKDVALSDLRKGGLLFLSIELTKEHIQVNDTLGILTGESRTIAERRGIPYESRFRLIAIYVEIKDSIRLRYFQSTEIT